MPWRKNINVTVRCFSDLVAPFKTNSAGCSVAAMCSARQHYAALAMNLLRLFKWEIFEHPLYSSDLGQIDFESQANRLWRGEPLRKWWRTERQCWWAVEKLGGHWVCRRHRNVCETVREVFKFERQLCQKIALVSGMW